MIITSERLQEAPCRVDILSQAMSEDKAVGWFNVRDRQATNVLAVDQQLDRATSSLKRRESSTPARHRRGASGRSG